MLPHVLEMRRISKQFPGVRALDNVTLHVRRGHIHALLGENGAGKSTLMKILDGVYPAGTFGGEIILAGIPIELHSPHDAQRKGIGYVPQEINVLQGLTVAENIFVGHWVDRGFLVTFRDLFARASQFLKQINIDLDPHRLVSSLNASERQLVMIARAMSTRPSVLILDESTACLTQDEADNLFRILRLLQQQGVTSLFITHKLSEVFELADRATVMRDGAVVAHFDRNQLNENDIVSAMIGRKIENFYPSRDSTVGHEEVLRVENLTVCRIDGLTNSLAAKACPAVAPFHCLVRAGRSTRGDGGAANRPRLERDIDLDGRVAATVEDLAGMNICDGGHGAPDAASRQGCLIL